MHAQNQLSTNQAISARVYASRLCLWLCLCHWLVWTRLKTAFYLSVLAGRKGLVLASLNGKVEGARVHFSRHNSRALADRSGRNKRLWSMSRSILARTSFENSCVPFMNWLVGPRTTGKRPYTISASIDRLCKIFNTKTPDSVFENIKSLLRYCVPKISTEETLH